VIDRLGAHPARTWLGLQLGRDHVDVRGRRAERAKQLAAGTATVAANAFDLAPLLAFVPGPAGGASGRLDGTIDVRGFDPKTSQLAGKLHVADARVPLAPQVGTLRNAAVDITIGQHDIKLVANGKLGRGTADINGTIALDRFSPTGGQAKIILKHISPIGSVQPLVDAQVSAKIARKGEQWTADVTVDHGFVKLEKGGEKLKPVGAPRDIVFGARPPPTAAKPGSAPPPKEAMFVINLTLKPTPVESDQVRTTVKGNLHITADLQGVDITGQVEAMGGDVNLFDRRYRIEQAEVRFDGTPDPVLVVEISYDFPEVTLTAQVRGRGSKPQLLLSSNPGNYTQAQLLGFLLGGEPGGDAQAGSLADTATSTGASFLGSQIGGYVKSAIPGIKIDVLKYSAATATTSEAIQAGSWITHTLYFQFTEHPEARPDENAEEGTLEWWFTHRLELQVTAGDRNYDGVDMLWRKRY
jgi:autotransporter translocation and assembly factor TamB